MVFIPKHNMANSVPWDLVLGPQGEPQMPGEPAAKVLGEQQSQTDESELAKMDKEQIDHAYWEAWTRGYRLGYQDGSKQKRKKEDQKDDSDTTTNQDCPAGMIRARDGQVINQPPPAKRPCSNVL